ncbi:MAG: hypothetical protein JF597_06875 [Streptomyces sp.]|uniref:hypothetical protein n=1 Tax=Streptomyces sp. TaxID=1931 RepID=UPI0025F6A5F9|nr:hypothetical protein [Streptomyces sp.]MBW8793315.1 hypothetical protein [Streptomyces sp.]
MSPYRSRSAVSVSRSPGSTQNPHDFVPLLLGRRAAGRFPVERLVTAFPFTAIDEAVARTKEDVVKPVLTF